MNCTKCGQEISNMATACEHCGAQVNEVLPTGELRKPDNVLFGIFGALIGALIGGLCIVLLGQAGYVASFSGIVLALCTLKGYELLGGRLSKVGIAVSAVLILVIPFCAYLVTSGMIIMDEVKEILPNLTLPQGIQLMFEMMQIDTEMRSDVVKEVLQLYLYTGLGVVAYLMSKKKTKK